MALGGGTRRLKGHPEPPLRTCIPSALLRGRRLGQDMEVAPVTCQWPGTPRWRLVSQGHGMAPAGCCPASPVCRGQPVAAVGWDMQCWWDPPQAMALAGVVVAMRSHRGDSAGIHGGTPLGDHSRTTEESAAGPPRATTMAAGPMETVVVAPPEPRWCGMGGSRWRWDPTGGSPPRLTSSAPAAPRGCAGRGPAAG